MSLLSWQNQSAAVPGTTADPAVPVPLTPLHMTIVGALLIAVGPISMTLYTPALTLLTRVFATNEAAIRTTITVYLFGFALAQLICGPLSDRYGRRPVVLWCLGLYLIGSLVCAGAVSVLMLDGGRIIQGIGACGGMALSRVMVVDRFTGPAAARIISMMSLILSIAPAAAPVLGGTLITVMSWRLLFALMVIYGAVLFVLVWQFPETNSRPDPLATRPRSLVVNYAALLTSRAFLGQVVLTAFAVGGFYTAQTLSPFILMGRLGLASPTFGLVTASLMVAYLFGSLATNRLLRFVSVQRLVVFGAVLVMVAALALGIGLRYEFGVAEVVGPMCLWLFGMAFIMPGVTTAALALFPRNAGSAAALMGSLQMGMGFVGSAVAGLLPDAVEAMATVPAIFGTLSALIYFAANRNLLRRPT
ncbi:MAG: multidrug effflux MFS transporter [Alphaproteobacteria bacterium]|nr:multidrug effflux MFS transporter [Alphaproteobacteria bacterium]